MQITDIPAEKGKFEQIYQQYKELMYYVAEQILRNPQDAEDAVHNAFLYLKLQIQCVRKRKATSLL